MEQWIGKPKISAELQPRIADRDDFLIKAIGPGPTDYTFPLSLTRTVIAVWQEPNSEIAAIKLASAILSVGGTASAPPKQGFWFDSYNSSDTLRQTISDIENFHIQEFIKDRTPDDIYGRLLGDEIWSEVEQIDKVFLDKFGFAFFSSLENAFERSQVLDDLNKPPEDNANYLYRVCILSGLIDHIAVSPPGNFSHEGSLQKFRRWLANMTTDRESTELTNTFRMIKKLRKQYPIHDHFETSSAGRKIRREVQEANEYFEITDPKSYSHNWTAVLGKFGQAIHSIIAKLNK